MIYVSEERRLQRMDSTRYTDRNYRWANTFLRVLTQHADRITPEQYRYLKRLALSGRMDAAYLALDEIINKK